MAILLVNEFYGPTFQGEGRTQGMPCHFLRMAGCNLACIWCDTPFTWNWEGTQHKHPIKFDKSKESHKVKSEDLAGEILRFGETFKVKNLVLTGGEPLLQQARLPSVLSLLKKAEWRIECETNGTIAPTNVFAACIDQFNISPKLSNSGESHVKRLKWATLNTLALADKCYFKFVVKGYEDAEEIEDIIKNAEINPERVWLMPEATTQEEHAKTEPIAAFLAKKNGWNYSDRRHIVMYGNRRKV